MIGRPHDEAPEGFYEFAAVSSVGKLRRTYKFGVGKVDRLLSAMPADWRNSRNALMAEMQRKAGFENVMTPEQRREYRASLARKKRALNPPGPRVSTSRPMPADFYVNALEMTTVQLAAHYNIARSSAGRLLDHLPPEQREAVREAGRIRRQRASRANAVKLERAIRAEARAARASIAASEKADKSQRPLPTRNFGFGKPTVTADMPGGIAQRAVDHLKRHYAPAFNAERVYGKEWAGLFVVGREKLDKGAVVDLARKHGFAPDAWRELAA